MYDQEVGPFDPTVEYPLPSGRYIKIALRAHFSVSDVRVASDILGKYVAAAREELYVILQQHEHDMRQQEMTASDLHREWQRGYDDAIADMMELANG